MDALSAAKQARAPFRAVRFLRATAKDDTSVVGRELGIEDSPEHDTAVGLEARNFYESVISMEKTVGSVCGCTSSAPQSKLGQNGPQGTHIIKKPNMNTSSTSTKCPRQSERVRMRNIHTFLRSAQEGDVKTMKLLLDEGRVDINVRDSFSWTALMCASYSGQCDAVMLLLRKGALWEHYQDKTGQTALDLAKMAGQFHIVKLLQGHKPSTVQLRSEKKMDEKFWCDICKVEFGESSRREHQSCTVHLFNCQHKPQSTLYYIPESNIGFQMMMKDGWDKEQGLGPDGAGLKFPVKTVLKRDRKGLGAGEEDEATKARVTHFKPFDVQAVRRPTQPREKKMRTTTLTKKVRKASEKRKRNWEMDFRRSFSLDM